MHDKGQIDKNISTPLDSMRWLSATYKQYVIWKKQNKCLSIHKQEE